MPQVEPDQIRFLQLIARRRWGETGGGTLREDLFGRVDGSERFATGPQSFPRRKFRQNLVDTGGSSA